MSDSTYVNRSLATKALFFVAFLGSGLAACGGSDDSAPVSIEFQIVNQGDQSQITGVSVDFQSRIVRTESDWLALWFSNTSITPPPPAPVVDFQRFMVIGVFLGGRPSGCYEIAVREVLLSPSDVEVVYREITPNGSGCQSVIVSPYQFISIPATALPVRFRKI